MSKIGKKPIEIPHGVSVVIDKKEVLVRGPLGELKQAVPDVILFEQKENRLYLTLAKESREGSALWGLFRALLQNAIVGVSKGFQKQLEIIGVGFKANMEKDKLLNLSLGFSHPVKMEVPADIKATVEKNIITVSGKNKQEVGQFAALIREKKKPEPYKGKGIRYLGEKVRRKEGKKAASASA